MPNYEDNHLWRKYLERFISLGLDKIPIDTVDLYGPWGVPIDRTPVEIPEEKINAFHEAVRNIRVEEKKNNNDNELDGDARDSFVREYEKLMNEYFSPYTGDVQLKIKAKVKNVIYKYKKKDQQELARILAEESAKTFKEDINDQILNHRATEYLNEHPDKQIIRDHLIQAYRVAFSTLSEIVSSERNKPFIDAIRQGKENSEIDQNVLYFDNPQTYYAVMGNPAQQQYFERDYYLRILEGIGKMDLKKSSDLLSEKAMDNLYWKFVSDPIQDDDIQKVREFASLLRRAGVDLEEYAGTRKCDDLMRKNRWLPSRYAYSMIEIVHKVELGDVGIDDLKETTGRCYIQDAIKALSEITDQFFDNSKAFQELEAQDLTAWYHRNGYDMFNNTMLIFNGFSEREVDGKKEKYLDLKEQLDESQIDRGMFNETEYKELVNAARKAQQYYRDNEGTLRSHLADMGSLSDGKLDGTILAKMRDGIDRDAVVKERLNTFKNLLSKVKAADEDVCVLEGIRAEGRKRVDPLKEDTDFNKKEFRLDERALLDRCEKILTEASKKVHRNSSQYKNVISSINNLKDALRKEYSNQEEARRAYVKGVDKILNNISQYRDHKAKDGLNTNDGTKFKLVALEQVDKLLRTRYRSAEKRVYEDNISGVADLFEINVSDEKYGNDYLADKAVAKIENMKKTLDDYRRMFDLGDVDQNGRRSLGVGNNTLELFESVLSLEIKPADEKKEEEIRKSLEKNEKMSAQTKAEEKYRASLDPKDDYGKDKLVKSAEKELYLISVMDSCIKKGLAEGNAAAADAMNKEMDAYTKKGSIQARAFKFAYMTDTDFNKEFQDRVLAGAEQGKVSREDIVRFRDEALEACYTRYKGKDVKALDNMSKVLGSNMDSRTASKVGIKGLMNEEAKVNPGEEKHTIKRTATLKEEHKENKKTGHTKG